MKEAVKYLFRKGVRLYIRTPLRGKTRLRAITDPLLMPAQLIEFCHVGPCVVPLSHEHEATRNMAYDAYEMTELALIRGFVEQGDTVLDIGANVGFFTAHLSSFVGPEGRVLSFEPGATPLHYFRQTGESCVYKNVEVIPSAVSGESGEAIYYETEVILSKGYGRINERPSARFSQVTEAKVNMISPIDIWKNHGLTRISFVKIDVEGQEKNIILAFEPIFNLGFFPVLMTEVTNEDRWRKDLEEYSEFLHSYGYSMRKAAPGLPKIGIDQLSDHFHGNVFWLRP
jgi:FkbM family methyltransferase